MCYHPYCDDRLRSIKWPVDWSMFDFWICVLISYMNSEVWSGSTMCSFFFSFFFFLLWLYWVCNFFLFLLHCMFFTFTWFLLIWTFLHRKRLYLRTCRISPPDKSNKCSSLLMLVNGVRTLTKRSFQWAALWSSVSLNSPSITPLMWP